MKKLGKISFILLSIMCITLSAYAFSCSMSLDTNKSEYKPGDDVVVDVKLTNIDAGDGVNALIATLEYDTNSLTYVSMQGQNTWNPTYNAANGKVIMDRSVPVTTPETVLTINFKVKEQSAKKPTITMKNISTSGGIATGDIAVSNISKTITVNTPTPPANNTTNTNTNTNTNTTPTNNTVPNTNTIITPTNNTASNTNTNAGATTNQNKTPSSNSTIVATTSNGAPQTDSVKTGILPKTGATRIGLAVLLIAVGVSVVFYIKMKKLDINVK